MYIVTIYDPVYKKLFFIGIFLVPYFLNLSVLNECFSWFWYVYFPCILINSKLKNSQSIILYFWVAVSYYPCLVSNNFIQKGFCIVCNFEPSITNSCQTEQFGKAFHFTALKEYFYRRGSHCYHLGWTKLDNPIKVFITNGSMIHNLEKVILSCFVTIK